MVIFFSQNYFLTIENYEQKDLGAYVCKAENTVGKDECKAQLKEAGMNSQITMLSCVPFLNCA